MTRNLRRIVLLSGVRFGTVFDREAEGFEVYALSFDYGQRPASSWTEPALWLAPMG
jgi:7-cyano-7-deazaguanine synthase in queuosine biosynthesis